MTRWEKAGERRSRLGERKRDRRLRVAPAKWGCAAGGRGWPSPDPGHAFGLPALATSLLSDRESCPGMPSLPSDASDDTAHSRLMFPVRRLSGLRCKAPNKLMRRELRRREAFSRQAWLKPTRHAHVAAKNRRWICIGKHHRNQLQPRPSDVIKINVIIYAQNRWCVSGSPLVSLLTARFLLLLFLLHDSTG